MDIDTASIPTARDRSLAAWAIGLLFGAYGMAGIVVAIGLVPEPNLRGRIHAIAMLFLLGSSGSACATLGKIAHSQAGNVRSMWWFALGSCIVSAVSFVFAFGPKCGGASSTLALSAAALVVMALVRANASPVQH